MASGLILAGSRITAALIQSIAPLSVIKGSDESVTSSATFQNDNELFVGLTANATYIFDCYLDYEGGTLAGSDLKWTWSVPAGATLRYQALRIQTGSVTSPGNLTNFAASDTVIAGTNGAGNQLSASMTGTLVVAATAGNLQLQWAQNNSNATATIVHAQSSLYLLRNS